MEIDFRLSTAFFSHPKIIKLGRKIGAEGVLAYITLLAFVAQNGMEGLLLELSAEDIGTASQYPGDPHEFMAALTSLGFIDVPKDTSEGWSYRLHDWGIFARVVPPRTDQQLFDALRHRARKEFSVVVFARDNHKCTYCGSKKHLTLDHIVPLSRGGSNDLQNLTTACRSCNSAKNNRTLEEWAF